MSTAPHRVQVGVSCCFTLFFVEVLPSGLMTRSGVVDLAGLSPSTWVEAQSLKRGLEDPERVRFLGWMADGCEPPNLPLWRPPLPQSEPVHLDDPKSLFRIGLFRSEGHSSFSLHPAARISSFHKLQLDSQNRTKHWLSLWVGFQDFIPASLNQKFMAESFCHPGCRQNPQKFAQLAVLFGQCDPIWLHIWEDFS